MNELEFYVCNGGKYPFAPRRDQMDKTRFITTPTTWYDDLRGQRLVEDYVENVVFAEKLGFDGCVILEQHGGPTALVGQANIMAATILAKTQRMRVGAVGAIMNSYASPQRYAEEIATLDIVSRGRYFFGLPMGIGPNYHTLGMNPTHAREKLREGHDFLVKAFTSDEPFAFDGKFFQTEYVNLWPKPLTKPYPECWIPAAGSKDSLSFAAKNGYTYVAVLVPWPILMKNCETFRNEVAAAGQQMDPRRIVATAHVHVAETDAQARLESEAHLMSLIQNNLGSPFHDSFPPGHVTSESLRGMMAGGYRSKDIGQTTFEEAQASGQIIVGSPSTVAERIEEITTKLGAGRLLVTGDSWTMPHWMARKNMTIFAEEVMPRFRSRTGKPIWDQDAPRAAALTNSEYGARVQPPKAIPSARIANVGNVDIRTAHVPELRKVVD
ncbi:MAG: LLM class flavin-dependent oxidoreductase [Rhodobacteraceae bacterium]|jgi:alkanesulfonate monooxygenase SsuD/methylene tetrahydromethanopterin reductase-like flavin-dependent oxidoreductase (luciferase family)|nr:LLM class flavin-dependent oxidoreductase [Paracoccaceae bacterium]